MKGGTGKLFVHMAIMALLILAGAVAAHFGLVLFTRHDARCTVPQFKGLILSEAEYVAQRSELNIIINDSLYAPMYEGGMVLEQLPKAGVEVKPGRAIYVTINAFGQKKVSVPYVAGRSLRQAKNMLEVAGLQIEKLVYESDLATNYVLSQSLNGEEMEEDSRMEAVVGSGVVLHVGVSEQSSTTRMPQLIGLTLGEAKSRLWETGLNVGQVNLPSDVTPQNRDHSLVYSQGVSQGRDVTLGSSIKINLTLDRERVAQILKDIADEERRIEKLKAQMEDSLSKLRIEQLYEEQQSRQQAPEPQRGGDSEMNFFE